MTNLSKRGTNVTETDRKIYDLLGKYEPILNIYIFLLEEKTNYDLRHLCACGKNDRYIYAFPEDGFRAYVVNRERSFRIKSINLAAEHTFSVLNTLLGSENELLFTFVSEFSALKEKNEQKAFGAYCDTFYGHGSVC